ncbi:MAG: M12 family metallo-peptidase [Myxococcota bacterium]
MAPHASNDSGGRSAAVVAAIMVVAGGGCGSDAALFDAGAGGQPGGGGGGRAAGGGEAGGGGTGGDEAPTPARELTKAESVAGDPLATFSAPGGRQIRLLAVYDASAVAEVGDIDAHAATMVANANEAYANSLMEQRLKLAGTTDVADFCPNLIVGANSAEFVSRRIAGLVEDDGYSDHVPALRERFAADVVALVIGGYSGGSAPFSPLTVPIFPPACGAISGFDISTEAEYAAFFGVGTVLAQSRAYTLAHELGHAQGAHHQLGAGANYLPTTPGGFALGITFSGCQRTTGTVMATSVQDRLPFFTGADVTYTGPSLGCLAPGDSLSNGAFGAADVLDESAPVVATLRAATDAFDAGASNLEGRHPFGAGVAENEEACAEACLDTNECDAFLYVEDASETDFNCALLGPAITNAEPIVIYRARLQVQVSPDTVDCDGLNTICVDGTFGGKPPCISCPQDGPCSGELPKLSEQRCAPP